MELPKKGMPTLQAPARPLEQSHFSLHTPPHSSAPSPREGESNGASTALPSSTDSAAEQEHEASKAYEWHFEILNHLPRDTAMALMDHMKSNDAERRQAQRYAQELNRSNKELHRRLQQKKEAVQTPRSRCGVVVLAMLLLVAISIGVACMVMDVRKPLLHGLDTLRGLLTDEVATPPGLPPAVQPAPSCILEEGATAEKTPSSGAVATEEETIRESSRKEVDKRIQQLQTENIQMRVQLEGLWIKIEEAEKNGQDEVCWKL